MAKRQSSSQPAEFNKIKEYKELLEEAVEEFNEWLLRLTKHQGTLEYCIKCRSRKTLPGLKFCKHCNGSDIDVIKPRMRRKTKDIIIKKKRSIKRNRSLAQELKGNVSAR